MTVTADTITLRFHRKDRVCTPCGKQGKHPLYMAETTVGKWWIVRRASLTEGSKGFGQATAILAESGVSGTSCEASKLVGIVFDGPAAEQAKAFTIKRVSQRVAQHEKYLAMSIQWAVSQNARMDALLAGDEIPRYKDGSGPGQWLRMKPGTTETDAGIETEVMHTSVSREAEQWTKWNQTLATLSGPDDPRNPKNFIGKLNEETGEWVPYTHEPEPLNEWFTPKYHSIETRRDDAQEQDQQNRERQNLEGLLAAIENGTTFKITKETELDSADVLSALAAHKADREKYYRDHPNHQPGQFGFTLSARDLGHRMTVSTKEAAKALGKLLRAGKVEKLGRGNYQAVS